jgi:prephenate dehydrogenase
MILEGEMRVAVVGLGAIGRALDRGLHVVGGYCICLDLSLVADSD